jgi:hypothetical protein
VIDFFCGKLLRTSKQSAFLLSGLLIASVFIGILAAATTITTTTMNNNAAFAENSNNNNSNSGNKGLVSNCQLNSPSGNITHVIHIQFDNTHFMPDIPNVPSDLEQMPSLLNFIKEHGVLYTNYHTPLISHTATDLLTGITGVYPDRMGVPVSNSYKYFTNDGKTSNAFAFTYWTAPLYDRKISKPDDAKFTMLTAEGKNAPAPWVLYTRAGCNFGAVAAANAALQSNPSDFDIGFASNQTLLNAAKDEAEKNPNQANADYIGIAIHCAKDSTMCSAAHNGTDDNLKDEPYGYSGYKAVFGHKNIAPMISSSLPMRDLNGSIIENTSSYIGFPGPDGMNAAVSLAYVAAMQEHGIPITYAYISDSHDAHFPGGRNPSYGPGEAGYVKALKANDEAFAKFFARLKNDGITEANTLFVFTSDEGDHFVGGPPTPANCDGITLACSYDKMGQINVDMAGLLAGKIGGARFSVRADTAPTMYLDTKPMQNATVLRDLERATANLTAPNYLHNNNETALTKFLADQVEMKILHMVTNDTRRNANLTLFADPDYYLYAADPNCNSACVTVNRNFTWSHGDVQSDITTTWLGMVGPGIKHKGRDDITWSDHADIRPTMMLLLGLKDDYMHDGRALVENMAGYAIPDAIKMNESSFLSLSNAYKKINAPLGQLSLDTLKISTQALKSNSLGDKTYNNLENQLVNFTEQRDAIKNQMIKLLVDAEFEGKAIDPQKAQALITQANMLLDQVRRLGDSLDAEGKW